MWARLWHALCDRRAIACAWPTRGGGAGKPPQQDTFARRLAYWLLCVVRLLCLSNMVVYVLSGWLVTVLTHARARGATRLCEMRWNMHCVCVMWCDVAWWDVMWCDVLLCCAVLWCVVLCRDMMWYYAMCDVWCVVCDVWCVTWCVVTCDVICDEMCDGWCDVWSYVLWHPVAEWSYNIVFDVQASMNG